MLDYNAKTEDDPTMRFIHYWSENCFLGKERWERMLVPMLVLLVVAYWIGRAVGFEFWMSPDKIKELSEYLDHLSIVFCVFCAFVIPFFRHEKEQKLFDDKMALKDAIVAARDAEIKRISNIKLDRAEQELNHAITALIKRISALTGIHPMNYQPNTDDETHAVLAEITGFIIGSLTPEAAVQFDQGVFQIMGASLSMGTPTTIYDDRHNEMIKRLEQRVRNLKAIKANLNNYLPV